MEKIEKLVEELEKQIRSIAEGVANSDEEIISEVSQGLDIVFNEIIEELKND